MSEYLEEQKNEILSDLGSQNVYECTISGQDFIFRGFKKAEYIMLQKATSKYKDDSVALGQELARLVIGCCVYPKEKAVVEQFANDHYPTFCQTLPNKILALFDKAFVEGKGK